MRLSWSISIGSICVSSGEIVCTMVIQNRRCELRRGNFHQTQHRKTILIVYSTKDIFSIKNTFQYKFRREPSWWHMYKHSQRIITPTNFKPLIEIRLCFARSLTGKINNCSMEVIQPPPHMHIDVNIERILNSSFIFTWIFIRMLWLLCEYRFGYSFGDVPFLHFLSHCMCCNTRKMWNKTFVHVFFQGGGRISSIHFGFT